MDGPPPSESPGTSARPGKMAAAAADFGDQQQGKAAEEAVGPMAAQRLSGRPRHLTHVEAKLGIEETTRPRAKPRMSKRPAGWPVVRPDHTRGATEPQGRAARDDRK